MRRLWLVVAPLSCLMVAACGSSDDDDGADPDGGRDAGRVDDAGTNDDAGVQGCQDPADWIERPTNEQIAALSAGRLCCADLASEYLERIATIDDGDEGINAMLALDDTATAQAAALDDPSGRGRALQCAVIGIKDNIDAEGMVTTAGSLAMVDNLAASDAPIVAGLRAAGALIVGKTNLSEWANFRGYGSTSGWSSFGGQTRNGADPTQNPCGSSSGSAAGVAARVLSAAIGTETSGSIICPSSVNGVVGLKPTVGLVSRSGIVPIADAYDTAGPITRTVLDAALLLGAIAGPDVDDPATASIPAGFDFDFVAALDDQSLDGARLGYDPLLVQTFLLEQEDLFNEQLARMEAAGAVLVPIDLPSTRPIGSPLSTVMATEFKVGINAYLAAHVQPGVPATLAELIEFNDAHAAEVMPYFGQEWFVVAEATAGLDDPDYQDARAAVARIAGRDGLLAIMDEDDLDAIVGPTAGPAWSTNYDTGDRGGPINGTLSAAAGTPHLTVPMGLVEGLPVGLSFVGRAFDDAAILSLGHAYEQLP